MSDPDLPGKVAAEIPAFLAEVQGWLRGESGDLGRIAASMSDDFTLVSPRGDVVPREELLRGLREAHGARPIRIRTANVVVRWSGGGAAIATYEEWHDHAAYTTARLSTALLTEEATAPGGLSWRHVQETWKIPPPPPAGR